MMLTYLGLKVFEASGALGVAIDVSDLLSGEVEADVAIELAPCDSTSFAVKTPLFSIPRSPNRE